MCPDLSIDPSGLYFTVTSYSNAIGKPRITHSFTPLNLLPGIRFLYPHEKSDPCLHPPLATTVQTDSSLAWLRNFLTAVVRDVASELPGMLQYSLSTLTDFPFFNSTIVEEEMKSKIKTAHFINETAKEKAANDIHHYFNRKIESQSTS